MGRWSRARACGWLSTAMSIRVSTDHKSFCQLATSMTLNQRAVFLGFSPIVTVQASDACARDTKWSRAAQAGLLGFAGERHGVYFLDLEWPLASMPNSSYAELVLCRTRPPGALALARRCVAFNQ